MSDALVIPPRPDILLQLQEIRQSDDPDMDTLAHVIKQDVAMYTILLSIVNSPAYKRAAPIASIEQALMILGINKVFTLLQAVLVRSSLSHETINEDFWNSSTEVATLCSVLAEKFIVADSEQAYSVGMLHAAGVPVMMQNFSHYQAFFREHGFRPAKELCYSERDSFGTDHYHQGYELARQWHMDEKIALAVRYQPISLAVIKDPKHLPPEVPALLSLLALAKSMSNEYRNYWRQNISPEERLGSLHPMLEYLQIRENEFCDLQEEMADHLCI